MTPEHKRERRIGSGLRPGLMAYHIHYANHVSLHRLSHPSQETAGGDLDLELQALPHDPEGSRLLDRYTSRP